MGRLLALAAVRLLLLADRHLLALAEASERRAAELLRRLEEAKGNNGEAWRR